MPNPAEGPSLSLSKKYAKHLSNLLAPRIPDLSHSESLNIIARLQGAKDWNTFSAADGIGFGSCFNSSMPSSEGGRDLLVLDDFPVFKDLNVFLNQIIFPKIDECAQVHGLKRFRSLLNIPNETGTPSCTLMHGKHVPAIEYDLYLEPAKASLKGSCSFRGKMVVTRHSVSISKSDIYLGFPRMSGDIAYRIAASPKIDTGDLIELLIQEQGSTSECPVDINLQGFFGWWSGSASEHLGDISADKETMKYLWSDLNARFTSLSKVFKAYCKYAGKWGNETAITTFIDTLGDIVTGEPRYRQVSRCFYEFTIKKCRFQLIMSEDGPHIICGNDGVQLDRGEIIHVKEYSEYTLRPDKPIMPGWHIAKYGDLGQIRVTLPGFNDNDVKKLCKELGCKDTGLFRMGCRGFEHSKAFDGMKGWMQTNLKYAREFKGKHQLYDQAWSQLHPNKGANP